MLVCAIHVGVFLAAHPVRGESHLQRHANQEAATVLLISSILYLFIYTVLFIYYLHALITVCQCQLLSPRRTFPDQLFIFTYYIMCRDRSIWLFGADTDAAISANYGPIAVTNIFKIF